MVEETQYLAVFFCKRILTFLSSHFSSYHVSDKQNCRTCDQVISELENIDDECDMYGIQMVKLKDPPLAKRWGLFIVSSYTVHCHLLSLKSEVIKFESKGMGSKLSLHLCISATETLWHLMVIWSQKSLCWNGSWTTTIGKIAERQTLNDSSMSSLVNFQGARGWNWGCKLQNVGQTSVNLSPDCRFLL